MSLYRLTEGGGCSFLRSLDPSTWGLSGADTGAAARLAWASDEAALAVGWTRGVSLWSPAGCRLMCTIPQGGGGGLTGAGARRDGSGGADVDG